MPEAHQWNNRAESVSPDVARRSKGLYVPRLNGTPWLLFILSLRFLSVRTLTMDHTHGDLEASALLTGSGPRVIYLRGLHIHSVTLMPGPRS